MTSPREREASDTTWTRGEAVLSCRWAATHDWCVSRISLQTKKYSMSHDAPRHDLQGAVSPQKTLGQRLREVDGNLPETLRTQCLAAGTAFIPELVAIVEQEMADAQGAHGWAPVHAVELLGMLGDAQTIPVLLRCLQRQDKLDIFYQKVREALVAFGPLAMDPCLDAYATTTDADLRDSLLNILGACPRISTSGSLNPGLACQ